MGDVVIYLVAEGKPTSPREVRSKIVSILQSSGIIQAQPSAFYPDVDESECYDCGERDLDAFTIQEDETDVAFQQCEIYGHSAPITLPSPEEPLMQDQEAFTTNVFVAFHETGGYSQLKPDWVAQLEQQCEVSFRVVSHWVT